MCAFQRIISRKMVYLVCLRHLKLSHHPSLSFIFTSLMNCRNEEQRTIQSNTQAEMGKKSKAPSSEDEKMAPLYTDTACNRDAGITTWEGMYNILEEENPRVMEVTAVACSQSSSEASLTELACSFLHRIGVRPKILPYMDMVKWILDNAQIKNRQFKIHGQGLIGSFVAQDLKLMYHLLEPQATYNKQFMEKFSKGKPIPGRNYQRLV